jgi:hypothetical protein
LAIKNACFISYSHGQGQSDLIKRFIEQLKKAFENELYTYLGERERVQPVFLDTARLKPGFDYTVSLSKAICESVCMIVVYTPSYDESDYCIREFCAMEKIERERIEKLGNMYDNQYRMIIPIILRGVNLPDNIKKIHYQNDFSKYALWSTEISQSPDFEPIIREIVNVIYEIYGMLRQDPDLFEHHNCSNFTIPSFDEVKNSWIKYKKQPIFPGRTS